MWGRRPGSSLGTRRLSGVAVALTVVIFGAGCAVGWYTACTPASVPGDSGGVRYRDGVPEGFSVHAKGAGDAAAWYLTLLWHRANNGTTADTQTLVRRLSVPGFHDHLTGALAVRAGRGRSLRQFVPIRVWAAGANRPTIEPDGSQVAVEVYGAVMVGARTNGEPAPGQRLSIDAFRVELITMQRHRGQWRFASVRPGVQVDPPAVYGSRSGADGVRSPVLARVYGPDSWIPYMR
ncbi:MAG: hypothetical protein ACRD0P_17965 [Stackebrandtia sp.]